MKKLNILAALCMGLFLHSCNCDKTYDCGTLSDNSLSWLNQNENDTIKFTNPSGQHLIFVVTARTVSSPYESQACKHSETGCTCDYRCSANGRFYASGDTAINNLNNYSVEIAEETDNKNNVSSVLTFSIFDFSKQIDILNPESLKPGDSLFSSLQLGNINYSNVYAMTFDTTNANQNKVVYKSYFTKQSGVVGFITRPSQTFFYRE
jgi:hypothetical protein